MKDEGGWKSKKPPLKPDEIREIVNPTVRRLNRKVKVNMSGKNQLIRIPVEVTQLLDIQVGDYFVFDIELPAGEDKPGMQNLRFKIEKDGTKTKA